MSNVTRREATYTATFSDGTKMERVERANKRYAWAAVHKKSGSFAKGGFTRECQREEIE